MVFPFVIILLTSCNLRVNLNKPIFYNKKSNSIGNLNANYSVSRMIYAKAKENCYLFKTSDITDASYRNVEYIVPESYFVVILADINSLVKKVQYNNKIGYVSADSVSVVDFIPVKPVLNDVFFDIAENVGTHLRKSPIANDTENILMVIPAGTKSVNYVASIVGVIPTGGSSNVWYYVSYSPASDPTSVYEGYVYSSKVINMSEIVFNEEGVVETEDEKFNDENLNFNINDSVKTILIIVICLPIILVFVLLVVGNKKAVKNKETKCESENINAEKKSDLVSKKLAKIEDFKDKTMKKKQPFYAKFVEEDVNENNNLSVNFPAYEVIDDDDLL